MTMLRRLSGGRPELQVSLKLGPTSVTPIRHKLELPIADAYFSDPSHRPTPLAYQVGCKSQPHVVGRPLPRRVAQMRLDAFTYTLEIVRAIRLGQHGGEAATEGREPSHD